VGTGAVTLGGLVGHIDRLEVRCRCGDCYGRMRLTKLIKEHGDDLGLPELAVVLANGCPKADTLNPADRCFVVFPQLAELFMS
jgi:hypothetical protein